MGYFANSSEAIVYQETYCENCVHGQGEDGPEGCPVMEAHFLFGYDLCNKKEHPGKIMLDMLIPRGKKASNKECIMFVAPLPSESGS